MMATEKKTEARLSRCWTMEGKWTVAQHKLTMQQICRLQHINQPDEIDKTLVWGSKHHCTNECD